MTESKAKHKHATSDEMVAMGAQVLLRIACLVDLHGLYYIIVSAAVASRATPCFHKTCFGGVHVWWYTQTGVDGASLAMAGNII